MSKITHTRADDHRKQAGTTVLIALIIAFFGAMFGVVFGVTHGTVGGPEAWVIGFLSVVACGLLCLLTARPAKATNVITGVLTVYLVIHLNVGSILAYKTSEEIVRIVPYATWFFPLLVFHQYTNFGFFKRAIGVLVSLSPVPITAYVLLHLPDPLANDVLDATVMFIASFFTFVLFISFYSRHRDEEVLRAASADEAERSAALLRVRDERFKLLGQATNDLLWDADLKAERMWWSDTLLNTYGYDPKVSRSDLTAWRNWIHPDERERVVESLLSVIEGGGSNWVSAYRFLCADGRTVDVVARGLVLRDDTGEPVRVIGSTADVSELRILERQLRQAQRMEAVGQLTGGVAHDFNNLLTIILGNAEALADIHANDPHARRLAETTMQAAERGAMLTSRLLSFARLQPLAPRHLDVAQLLIGIEPLICRTIDADIRIEIDVAAGAWPIEVDPGQLENAILNLAINARDAMPDGGRLTIKASNVTIEADDVRRDDMEAGAYVMIAVSDNGCGMPPDVTERAFEPFFTTKDTGKGSGLGLSMVWGFVQQSNGHAQIHSEPDKGTSIQLYFPAATEMATEGEHNHASG